MNLKREITFRTNVKKVSAQRVVTVGPITAKTMGIPVGTQIEQTVMWHRNPFAQLVWRFKHRDFSNRIKQPSRLLGATN